MSKERTPLITKYRPTRLEDLVGQQHIVSILEGAFKNKEIPNAFILSGPTGTGKTTTGRIIARYAMCDKLTACGECPSCKRDILSHPDYKEVNCASTGGKDDAINLINVARNMPQMGSMRVIMLDEVHKLTPQAREALLVPLENPPAKTLWILATTEPEALLQTLRDRCTTLPVRLVERTLMAEYLRGICKKEKLELDKAVLKALCEKTAEASGGYVRASLRILNGVLLTLAGTKEMPETPEDIEKLIVSAGQTTMEAIAEVAAKLYTYMMMGNIKGVVSSLASMEEPIPLANKMLQYSQYALDCLCSASGSSVWHTAENKLFWKTYTGALRGKGREPNPEHVIMALAAMVQMRTDMQRFAVGERYLITSCCTTFAMKVKTK